MVSWCRNILSANLITWISRCDKPRILEVAIPVVSAPALVVEVHGYGSMGYEVIWVEAWAASLQYAAVHLRARIVDVC